jgi:hypothetical protein
VSVVINSNHTGRPRTCEGAVVIVPPFRPSDFSLFSIKFNTLDRRHSIQDRAE